jgi:STE24 endopeptidase
MAGLLAVAALFPVALQRLWRTSPLPGDETGRSLAALATAEGFSSRAVRVWHTGGTTVNALMAGVSRWSRRVFLSDALLEALPREQACAVLAHEIGHARRRHVPWLVIWSLGVGMWAGLMTEWGAAAGGLSPEHPAAVWVMLAPVAAVLVSFGWVSRRFEWQADAFAVAAMARRAASGTEAGAREVVAGPEAVHAVAGALLSVARLAGIHPHRPSWRHGTIAQRVERVARLEGTPTGRFPIDRQARGIKWLAVGLVVSGLAVAAATGSL